MPTAFPPAGGSPTAFDTTEALARAGKLLQDAPQLAVEAARAIILATPDEAAAYAVLGLALARCGHNDEAVDALRAPAAATHESPDAWRLLGDLLGRRGDAAGADRAYAQQIRTSVNDPNLRRAALALADNDLPVAEGLLRGHLKSYPTDVAAIRMMAELAARIGRYPDATKLLRRALQLAPSFTAARHNLAIILYRDNHLADALAELDLLFAGDPDNPALHNLAGAVAVKVGHTDRAIGHFERALASAPDQPKVWMSYGHTLKTIGRNADSVAAYRRALALDPLLGESWWSLANLKTFRFDDADITAMEAALADPQIGDEARFHIAFALGKAHEDAGRYAASMSAYVEGNRLRREALEYDADETTTRVDRLLAALTPPLFRNREKAGCPAPDPIFVLGMPRSGSTLVEQILASHPDIEGTQELPDLHAIALRLGGGESGGGYADMLATLSADQLRALGEEYLQRTRIHRTSSRPLFVDKMPNNWLHTGLIRLILPNATIIDARRHPLACCFSNFKQHFARGQAFSYDLVALGRYYGDYVRMMAHLDAVLPSHVHRIFYENMVADMESEVRRLLAHVGVPFDPACLAFHRTERAVRTASSEQVRRPIFREGLDQWTHFDPWLAPLKEALGDVLTAYPDVPAFR